MSIKRRDMVKLTAGTALAASAAAVPFATGAVGAEDAPQTADRAAGQAAAGDDDYTETYQGRTIRVASAAAGGGVFIDGRPLHLMKFAEDAYLSSLCHYEMAPTPLVAARRAVEELRGAQLLPTVHGAHVMDATTPA
ncbi:tyrosinase family oxidase copper chaperone [Streptomyces sp. NPDC006339]|uniref:tyrosinase family oxidase copper chaperone n=1 Tax=Streptomyces sp. NPDC006339 TaxID=3156755 RepID=UPI0033ADCB66